ncbi:MAG: hypothetical protein Q9217_006980 [Psora testacea]
MSPSSRVVKKPRLAPKAMMAQEIDELKEQITREKEERKQRHSESVDAQRDKDEKIKELMDLLKTKLS